MPNISRSKHLHIQYRKVSSWRDEPWHTMGARYSGHGVKDFVAMQMRMLNRSTGFQYRSKVCYCDG